MGKTFYYDVYDGSRIVLEHVTSKEIQEHFGTDYPNLSYYTGGKAYYLSQYLITRHGAGEPNPPKRKTKRGSENYAGGMERRVESSMQQAEKRKLVGKFTYHAVFQSMAGYTMPYTYWDLKRLLKGA